MDTTPLNHALHLNALGISNDFSERVGVGFVSSSGLFMRQGLQFLSLFYPLILPSAELFI